MSTHVTGVDAANEASNKEERKKSQIHIYKPQALRFIERNPEVIALMARPETTEWKPLLLQGKNSGLIPLEENWAGRTICITLGNEKVYINEHRLDYEQWADLTLFQVPHLEISDRPYRFILPVVMRYILLP